MGRTFGGKIDLPEVTKEKPRPQIHEVTKGLQKASISESDYHAGLDHSNRENYSGNNKRVYRPELSYAYSDYIEAEQSTADHKIYGSPSLISEYAIVSLAACDSQNDFMDIDGITNGAFPQVNRTPTIESLVKDFPSDGSVTNPYYLSDFLFAKWYKKVPLNHLVTLRRYPYPTYDNLAFPTEETVKPIAQAITYFGEPTGNLITDLTKLTGEIAWKEMEADVWDAEGEERGIDDTPFFDKLGSKTQTAVKYGSAFLTQGSDQTSGRRAAGQEYAKEYGNDPNYTNSILGPVNVIHKTHIRDRGLGAQEDLTLVFEYKLRSIDGINPRVAMLDIMCNMLALAFNNAKFWGGANRYFSGEGKQQFSFLGDQKAFYEGRYGDYLSSFLKQVGDGLGRGLDTLTGIIGGLISGDLSALKGVIGGGASMMMDLQAAKSRPKIVGLHALLSGLPVGEWHLTVGNPHHPILMIGNLICKGFEMEYSGNLGVDDFPSDFKFTVKLSHGRPRDKGDIESMYNFGEGRIYYSPAGIADVSNMSSATKTNIIPKNARGKQIKKDQYLSAGEENADKIARGFSEGVQNNGTANIVKRMKGTLF